LENALIIFFRFPEGYFFRILKILNEIDPVKYFFSVSERYRWAVVGWGYFIAVKGADNRLFLLIRNTADSITHT